VAERDPTFIQEHSRQIAKEKKKAVRATMKARSKQEPIVEERLNEKRTQGRNNTS